MSGQIKLNLPSGGSKTIAAPDSAATETITLPAGTKTLATVENFTSTGIDDNATSTKLTTTSTGIDVTGTVTADGLTVEGGVARLTTSHLAFSGQVSTPSEGAAIYRPLADSVAVSTNNNQRLLIADNGDISFYEDTGTTAKFTFDASNGNLQFDSGYGSAATAYGCRAWVNFNGTGTVAIRDSGNVSSITDNGTGSYTVNFTTAMPDGNYSVATSSSHPERPLRTGISASSASGITTSSVRLQQYYGTGGAVLGQDVAFVGVAIFR